MLRHRATYRYILLVPSTTTHTLRSTSWLHKSQLLNISKQYARQALKPYNGTDSQKTPKSNCHQLITIQHVMILLASFLVLVSILNGQLQLFGNALQHSCHVNVSQSCSGFITYSASSPAFAAPYNNFCTLCPSRTGFSFKMATGPIDRQHVPPGRAISPVSKAFVKYHQKTDTEGLQRSLAEPKGTRR